MNKENVCNVCKTNHFKLEGKDIPQSSSAERIKQIHPWKH